MIKKLSLPSWGLQFIKLKSPEFTSLNHAEVFRLHLLYIQLPPKQNSPTAAAMHIHSPGQHSLSLSFARSHGARSAGQFTCPYGLASHHSIV